MLRTLRCAPLRAALSRATGAAAQTGQMEYRLLATNKTGTMQKEWSEAGDQGYEFVGVTVGETSFGGNEVVSIMRRRGT